MPVFRYRGVALSAGDDIGLFLRDSAGEEVALWSTPSDGTAAQEEAMTDLAVACGRLADAIPAALRYSITPEVYLAMLLDMFQFVHDTQARAAGEEGEIGGGGKAGGIASLPN